MSDTITKIISENPYSKAVYEQKQKIAEYLKDFEINAEENEFPQFIDCGGNLEEITCPCCGETLDFDWWGEKVSELFENDFSDPTVTVPCCGKSVSVNDLKYNMPCGFASAEISINDNVDLSADDIATLNGIVGEPIRIIKAHY